MKIRKTNRVRIDEKFPVEFRKERVLIKGQIRLNTIKKVEI